MRIKTKITLLTTSWLIGILLAMNVGVYFAFLNMTTDSERDWLCSRVDLLMKKASIAEFFDPGNNDLLQSYLPDHGMIRVLDASGVPVKTFYSHDELKSVPIMPVMKRQSSLVSGPVLPLLIFRNPITENDRVIGTLEFGEELDALDENISILILIQICSSLGAIVLCFLGGSIVAKWILKPITKLALTMESIERSLVFQKIHVVNKGHDEIKALAVTFNRMIDRIEESFAKQRQFVSDASHELKTPLTIIEGYASLLLRWGLEDEKSGREAAESIYSEALRMRQMTMQLLQLAASEQIAPITETVDMVQLCAETITRLRHMVQRDIQLVTKVSQLIVEADPLQMKQMLILLLDNAIKYSSDLIHVELLAQSVNAEETIGLEIRVKDHGIGIPKEELAQVFERFYRVDPSRDRKTGGTGLGLSIARNIVNMNSGTIRIKSEVNVGTEVIVFFPFRIKQ
ncbi:sensor histidine kinase [Paenibacillus cremeus]|uniref:Signal transduction histidine-protein kinase ArlS n=1 Tax=Paenibacillus cremeus TaxID=2163881 RepID=A0A559K4J4_9BACL|nr:ATP-binding protein [Paenibacillus cremeus]TVY07010.1 HAMP domain-containing histidine kinase [Paenibacillus cremeus]